LHLLKALCPPLAFQKPLQVAQQIFQRKHLLWLMPKPLFLRRRPLPVLLACPTLMQQHP
jgi:hypothetical protein